MKKTLLLTLAALFLSITMKAQLIDNKGNRNQTYPIVNETNPAIVEMVTQVDTINLFNTISYMQQFIRAAWSPEALTVQNYLLDRFDELGLETYIHKHTGQLGQTDTLDAGNVIAIQPGTEYSDEYIIIASHYDHPDGPGADDNASGTAGVLECARILSQYQFKRTILYVPFNGEESWMVGSFPFAQKCAREEMNILGVFDFDMIGFWPENHGDVTLYSGYSYISQHLFEFYQHVANLYVPETPTYRFTVQGDSYGGDHMSFNIYEYPALYIGDIEYHSENIHYHHDSDTIGAGVNCFRLAEGFVKTVVASVAELADSWVSPQNFCAVVNDGNVVLNWDASHETQSYKIYKDNELLAETTDTSFIDKNFTDGEWHKYFVKGVNADGEESPASNLDSVFDRTPLQIPVFYDFEDGTNPGLILNNDKWSFCQYKQRNVLKAESESNDNCFQILETQWFSIPETATDISLSFIYWKHFLSIWIYNSHVVIEATTDRRHWHKLSEISKGISTSYAEHSVSLNDFIGCTYVKVRIRFESSGAWNRGYDKKLYIDDLRIDFTPDAINENVEDESFNLSVFPNPSNGNIAIKTDLNHEYLLEVYNVLGIKVIEINDFSDGILDISELGRGIYFVSASNGIDKITKRVVVE